MSLGGPWSDLDVAWGYHTGVGGLDSVQLYWKMGASVRGGGWESSCQREQCSQRGLRVNPTFRFGVVLTSCFQMCWGDLFVHHCRDCPQMVISVWVESWARTRLCYSCGYIIFCKYSLSHLLIGPIKSWWPAAKGENRQDFRRDENSGE